MATKLEKMARQLNDDFRDHLAEAVKEKFGLEIETHFNFMDMRLVTHRTDGEEFTPEQHAFIGAYSEGYGRALELVRRSA